MKCLASLISNTTTKMNHQYINNLVILEDTFAKRESIVKRHSLGGQLSSLSPDLRTVTVLHTSTAPKRSGSSHDLA